MGYICWFICTSGQCLVDDIGCFWHLFPNECVCLRHQQGTRKAWETTMLPASPHIFHGLERLHSKQPWRFSAGEGESKGNWAGAASKCDTRASSAYGGSSDFGRLDLNIADLHDRMRHSYSPLPPHSWIASSLSMSCVQAAANSSGRSPALPLWCVWYPGGRWGVLVPGQWCCGALSSLATWRDAELKVAFCVLHLAQVEGRKLDRGGPRLRGWMQWELFLMIPWREPC